MLVFMEVFEIGFLAFVDDPLKRYGNKTQVYQPYEKQNEVSVLFVNQHSYTLTKLPFYQ